MLYRTPALADDDKRVLGELDTMRDDLRYQIAEPHRWTGQLRRTLIAHAIQGSNSIEGYQVSLDDAAAAVVRTTCPPHSLTTGGSSGSAGERVTGNLLRWPY